MNLSMPGTANKIEDPCQECRERHLKCDDSRPKCKQCERLGQKCRRGKGKLKFRHGSSARYDTSFAKDQTWLEQTKSAKFQFVDQGPELENYYSQDDIVVTTARPQAQDPTIEEPIVVKRYETSVGTSPAVHSAPATEAAFLSPQPTHETVLVHSPIKRRRTTDSSTQPYRPPWSHGAYDPIRSQYRIYDTPKPFGPVHAEGSPYMPAQRHVPKVVEAEYRRLADADAAAIPPESLLSPAIWKEEFYWPNQYTTTQCACLMRYYIQHLAPWFDVGDPARHFTLTVPQRARRCPPLLNAIFTAASRHMASMPEFKGPDGIVRFRNVPLPNLTADTALKYHNACIAYLIKLSTDAEHVRDEDLLAAAVILRYYEEIDTTFTGKDSETFLHTFQLFVHAQSSPYSDILLDGTAPQYLRPGSTMRLRENALAYLKSFQHATFRVALRQETTIAFMKQRAVRLPLQAWSILQGFEEVEDFVWSDRHLYHCAQVLQYCFGGDLTSGRASLDRWSELKDFESQWAQAKPLTFSPIHYEDADRAKGEHLPQIWYMAETHITGLLHLDLARILLAVYNPNIPRIGQGVSAAHRRIIEEVHDIVLRLCGTAVSAASQPAMVQAYMAIAVCGEYFSDPNEQQVLLDILSRLEREFGWPTTKTALELKREWGWGGYA